MNNLIEVGLNISECDRYLNSISTHFDELDKIFNDISTNLNDKSKWDGKIRDKCSNINYLIAQYAKSIRPLCSDLQRSINNLEKNASEFASNSYLVEKLRNW